MPGKTRLANLTRIWVFKDNWGISLKMNYLSFYYFPNNILRDHKNSKKLVCLPAKCVASPAGWIPISMMLSKSEESYQPTEKQLNL